MTEFLNSHFLTVVSYDPEVQKGIVAMAADLGLYPAIPSPKDGVSLFLRSPWDKAAKKGAFSCVLFEGVNGKVPHVMGQDSSMVPADKVKALRHKIYEEYGFNVATLYGTPKGGNSVALIEVYP